MNNLREQIKEYYAGKKLGDAAVSRILGKREGFPHQPKTAPWLKWAALFIFMGVVSWSALGFVQQRRDARLAIPHEVNLRGEVKCADCILHQQKGCERVLETMVGGKSVVYRLDLNEVNKGWRGQTCQRPYTIVASGKARKVNGKFFLAPEKIQEVQ